MFYLFLMTKGTYNKAMLHFVQSLFSTNKRIMWLCGFYPDSFHSYGQLMFLANQEKSHATKFQFQTISYRSNVGSEFHYCYILKRVQRNFWHINVKLTNLHLSYTQHVVYLDLRVTSHCVEKSIKCSTFTSQKTFLESSI